MGSRNSKNVENIGKDLFEEHEDLLAGPGGGYAAVYDCGGSITKMYEDKEQEIEDSDEEGPTVMKEMGARKRPVVIKENNNIKRSAVTKESGVRKRSPVNKANSDTKRSAVTRETIAIKCVGIEETSEPQKSAMTKETRDTMRPELMRGNSDIIRPAVSKEICDTKTSAATKGAMSIVSSLKNKISTKKEDFSSSYKQWKEERDIEVDVSARLKRERELNETSPGASEQSEKPASALALALEYTTYYY